jgi:hypothetical protein
MKEISSDHSIKKKNGFIIKNIWIILPGKIKNVIYILDHIIYNVRFIHYHPYSYDDNGKCYGVVKIAYSLGAPSKPYSTIYYQEQRTWSMER